MYVVLAISTAVVCQDVTPEYPERGLEDEPIEEDQELPTEPREETAQVPAAAPAVSVQPLTVPAASYVPAGVPPSGVIFSNGPAGNVQSFQVPGAGMALGEGKKIPFILINNVAAGAAGGKLFPRQKCLRTIVASRSNQGRHQRPLLSSKKVRNSRLLPSVARYHVPPVDRLCANTMGPGFVYSAALSRDGVPRH
ncbi:hypothetical protein CSUI_008032 [Cystoisospora suis]|uniref:Uncharacterized protein n=1 Tax=Cystoisospora suis TaxID=483139 RepID=A0A2C6KP41_9APIC|nr:hypothetical protein CSUI_008032 [Cystoisospora suis]